MLREFWAEPRHGDAEQGLKAWLEEVSRANRKTPADVKTHYGNASILKNGRVVFNFGGNKYCLVVAIKYSASIVFVRFIGTHVVY